MVIMSNIPLSTLLAGVKMTSEQSAYFLWGYICSMAETLADQELEGKKVDNCVRNSIEEEYREILAKEIREGGDCNAKTNGRLRMADDQRIY